jgi:hypothetical protein
MNDTPHDDGPKVAKLFADIDARTGYREALPATMDVRAAAQAPDENPEALASNGDPEDGDAPSPAQVQGQALIQEVGVRLHQAGEAAIAILANMCEAEFALGNPRNMPEPMLGWYALSLTYQLCVLEFTGRAYDEREAHARQLAATTAALGRRTSYAQDVQAEINALLAERVPTVRRLLDLGDDGDVSYGVLAWT